MLKTVLRSLVSTLGYTLLPAGTLPVNVRQIKNINYMHDMFSGVRHIEGSIVECGVGRGRTFLYLNTYAWLEGTGRKVWGFDSFEGFPEPTQADASVRAPKKGEWAGTSPQDIQVILRNAGIPEEYIQKNVHLVKGFVETTLAQYDQAPIALLHIDLDLYEAYKTSLETLVPFVADGGLVLFDEYGHERWPGATKAVDEYLKDKPWSLQKHVESGKYYFSK